MTEVLLGRTDSIPSVEGVAALAMMRTVQSSTDKPRPGEVEHLPLDGDWWEDDRYLTVLD